MCNESTSGTGLPRSLTKAEDVAAGRVTTTRSSAATPAGRVGSKSRSNFRPDLVLIIQSRALPRHLAASFCLAMATATAVSIPPPAAAKAIPNTFVSSVKSWYAVDIYVYRGHIH